MRDQIPERLNRIAPSGTIFRFPSIYLVERVYAPVMHCAAEPDGSSEIRVLVSDYRREQFAKSRVPNVSGGLVVSKIPQRTSHSLEYNVRLAQIAEKNGFEFALTQIRFLAGYGAEEQHEVNF